MVVTQIISWHNKSNAAVIERRTTNLGLEVNPLALLPHVRDESLTWQHWLGKPDLHGLEVGGVVTTIMREYVASREAQRAETVKDGTLEATEHCDVRINVKWVPVSGQPIQCSLHETRQQCVVKLSVYKATLLAATYC